MNTATPLQIDLKEVESSQIHSIGYDAASKTLAIRFRNRSTGAPTTLYHYANVTPEDFVAFDEAESKGSHFGKHIKPYDVKFPFQKINESATA
ncbi:KTSC domain-containing protein [Paraburkholderia caballeronis]|uniref:KTSC domain-containing protein n=1 Tax=Paraburkholderia caballeronis TaxID=416943 RepID=A0A1H7TYD5_9BURK|nr:KTSC domain-containing protein [Paraburkholderia caballeronis]PXW23382.1 KTSC domain-containing protein [Paraburkholderia caballeronis]PXW98375.1 KTSC domain-containing protein [Paraburkholderia caballeronis]RAJ95106.1 KTSC domain-containing protein [Paraburkholderia caballeronis]SEC56893.1 KTSC domain-containing protein [Paraburkholderia caballeronis]SEL89519.1 KTSC domain-containing protein [Paraburkholderia caballeronis]